MPIIIHTDQDAQDIRLESKTVDLPAFTKLIDFITADAAIVNLRLQSRFPLQQLRSGKEHIATTELFHRIATVTIPVATAVRDGISLEQDHTILFQINLRSMYGCIFFNSGFCDLRDHQGTEPCQRSLFKEVSSGILHG